MNLFALDISGSMSATQITQGCHLVKEKYQEGDMIAIFDHNSAKTVKLYELDLVVRHKTTSELRHSLYKKRKRIVGFGMCGSKLAAQMAKECKKICITNKYITDDEASKYNEVIKL